MAVLRMGFPGLESATRYTFLLMRNEEINAETISLVSRSILIPRASMHLQYFTNILFGNHIPFNGSKVITPEDLMELELVEVKPYIIVEVYPDESNFSAYAYFSKSFSERDEIIGTFREKAWPWDATCGDYNTFINTSQIDISKMPNDKAWNTEYKMFKIFSTMIPCATLLYYLYNLDNGVRLISPDSSDTENIKKVRSVVETVRKMGNSFQEIVESLIIGARYTLL
jgi:hypothetical protein